MLHPFSFFPNAYRVRFPYLVVYRFPVEDSSARKLKQLTLSLHDGLHVRFLSTSVDVRRFLEARIHFFQTFFSFLSLRFMFKTAKQYTFLPAALWKCESTRAQLFKAYDVVNKRIVKILIIKYDIYDNIFAEKMWVAFSNLLTIFQQKKTLWIRYFTHENSDH